MGEEVRIADEDRVWEWEDGLPGDDDLTPLSQGLVPAELASAFKIPPEPSRNMVDVHRASQNTVSSFYAAHDFNTNNFKSFNDDGGMDPRKVRRVEQEVEDAENNISSTDDGGGGGGGGPKTVKRPRLVWTPQLHKRFIEVVAHLGVKNAVPKTIMQLMNVEGLTRENVASHLQKYRLYLKRMQGLSNEGPSSSDHLFASTPPPSESGGHGQQHSSNVHMGMPMPMPMPMPMQMPYPPPMMGMAPHGGHGHTGGYHGYNMMQQRDWSGNSYGSAK